MDNEEDVKVSYWEVFLDDVGLLFFLGAAVYFALYIVWGAMEIASVSYSPLIVK
ncbi:hypothetical protein MNBD_NITROSPINAE01-1890 [hydrothermal vent metagenome]|uniref:Uncharacterized protein n=1 Tax=hydrothermal vent metagenome TaxID=652676 RepID=A0A3B1C5Y5_9ZZZZ